MKNPNDELIELLENHRKLVLRERASCGCKPGVYCEPCDDNLQILSRLHWQIMILKESTKRWKEFLRNKNE